MERLLRGTGAVCRAGLYESLGEGGDGQTRLCHVLELPCLDWKALGDGQVSAGAGATQSILLSLKKNPKPLNPENQGHRIS